MPMVAQGQPVHFEILPGAAKPAPELVFPEGYIPGVSAVMRAVCEQLRQRLAGEIPVFITSELEGRPIALARTRGNISRTAPVRPNSWASPATASSAEWDATESSNSSL